MHAVYGIRETLQEYFELQAEKLLADTQAASTLTTHRGLSGTASEGAARSFFSAHLPEKYGVGMGHIGVFFISRQFVQQVQNRFGIAANRKPMSLINRLFKGQNGVK